ncbi:MAG TPA: sulfotransferase domain-containing protein [Xanthobacteraceae bacterium]|nr:sulfotransferase domain-containing protein [Xanthobacteraceae bacterium]
MKDITYIAAFPKSGITYLNFMLFHILFDRPQDARRIDSDYIFDVHESLARVPAPGATPFYVKIHFPFGPRIPLRERASRAVYLWRDPIDVMMSVWDFKHLTGEDGLLDAAPSDQAVLFQRFCQHWLTTGGLVYPFAGSWRDNVSSWLDQTDLPVLVVRYERLRTQPFEQLRRILAFLRREATDERILAAVAAGKPENMRKLESEEVGAGVSGIFYRPALAKGYARGYRFVGRMHGGSSEKVLTPAARQYANQIFGPVLERACARAK